MATVQARHRPVQLDAVALKLPVQMRQDVFTPNKLHHGNSLLATTGTPTSSKLAYGSPHSVSTAVPSTLSPILLSRKSSLFSASDCEVLQSPASASPASIVCSAPGYTPLAHAARGVTDTPTASLRPHPMPSPGAAASPATILRYYGPASGVAYPPGMGFTPAATKMGYLRKGSFGMSAEQPQASAVAVDAKDAAAAKMGYLRKCSFGMSAEQPQAAAVAVDAKDGAIPREMLLMCRETSAGLVGAGLTAEAAGFLSPEPGWISTRDLEEDEDKDTEPAHGATRQPDRPKAREVPQDYAAHLESRQPDRPKAREVPQDYTAQLVAKAPWRKDVEKKKTEGWHWEQGYQAKWQHQDTAWSSGWSAGYPKKSEWQGGHGNVR